MGLNEIKTLITEQPNSNFIFHLAKGIQSKEIKLGGTFNQKKMNKEHLAIEAKTEAVQEEEQTQTFKEEYGTDKREGRYEKFADKYKMRHAFDTTDELYQGKAPLFKVGEDGHPEKEIMIDLEEKDMSSHWQTKEPILWFIVLISCLYFIFFLFGGG